jgi:hypothetical protein
MQSSATVAVEGGKCPGFQVFAQAMKRQKLNPGQQDSLVFKKFTP